MKILMTGVTGLIGQKLGLALALKNHEITVISRRLKKAQMMLPFPAQIIEADLNQQPVSSLQDKEFDAVIHLAGESVAQSRWTPAIKENILQSRILSTRHLIQSLKKKPRHFICASAIGYYGDRKNEWLETTSGSADESDFLAQVCKAWEQEALQSPAEKIAILRIGLVLSRQGGALEKMLFPFQAGVGGALGDGKAWMSWIHVQDLVELLVWILEQNKSGIYHGTSNQPVRNLDFSKTLAQVLHKPLGLSVPRLALKILFGEMSRVLLSSQRVTAEKNVNEGFKYQFPDLQGALEDLLPVQKNNEDVFWAQQFVPKPIEEVFEFFSEAQNLEKITPDFLNFKIQKMSTPEITEGSLIDYRLKIHGVPARWRTRIENWNPPHQFVDTQLQGPYQKWHHTHQFQSLGGGTLMTDRVVYRLPMGYLGWLGAGAFVRRDVTGIFNYRRQVIYKMFGSLKIFVG